MKPALSADEWCFTDPNQWLDSDFSCHTGCHVEEGREHAMAAVCLHDQPFGFTRERLASLGRIIDDAERWQGEHGWMGNFSSQEDLDNARADRDRIEALLPLETTDDAT